MLTWTNGKLFTVSIYLQVIIHTFFLRSLKYWCVLFQTSTLYSGEKHYTMGSLSTPLDIVCIILELKKKLRILEHIGLRGHITDYGVSLYKVCSN